MKGPSGAYRVQATMNGAGATTVSTEFQLASGRAQKRVVLRFPSQQANE